jgi:N-acetylated-alpha-linked acidic dipeptidase
VDGARAGRNLWVYANESHIAGSPQDFVLAQFTAEQMRAAGIPQVEIQNFSVLLSYPLTRLAAVVAPAGAEYTAVLEEAAVAVDPTSSKPAPPLFHGYSGNGDATGDLVYANYGAIEDYQYLDSMGVNLTGKVVICRYGGIYRGNKVFQAEARGAAAVIIYSDPYDMTEPGEPVYPAGPWATNTTAQRGSVWLGNGDPLTPGLPSISSTPRITMQQAYDPSFSYGTPLPSIPSLPMSYGDAQHFIEALGGPVAPSDWQGGFNFTYRIGPGPVRARVAVTMNYTNATIHNVIGTVPGALEPDRLVLLGNHRDAWAFGAVDPNSGTAALLEVAHGLGRALATGWQPRRTIVLCSWDAEEYATVGSAEYVELREKTLFSQAVAYLNVDISVTGCPVLDPGGVPSFTQLFRQITPLLAAPPGCPASNASAPQRTLYDLWMLDAELDASGAPVLDASDMGTGSDYGAFLQHAGVPAMDIRFESEDGHYEAVYHSSEFAASARARSLSISAALTLSSLLPAVYDSYYYISHFGDLPGFPFIASLAQLWGLTALRLADSPLIPLHFTEYPQLLTGYVTSIAAAAQAANLTLNLSSLNDALSSFSAACAELETAIQQVGSTSDPLLLRRLNDRIMSVERGLLFLQGLPGREWYRHVVWATSQFDGYGSVGFSPILDAVRAGDASGAQYYVALTATIVYQAVDTIAAPF